jgi:hypothetical protein
MSENSANLVGMLMQPHPSSSTPILEAETEFGCTMFEAKNHDNERLGKPFNFGRSSEWCKLLT